MPEKNNTYNAARYIPLFIFLSLYCFYCLLLSTHLDGYERGYYATAQNAILQHEFNMGDAGLPATNVIEGKRYVAYVLEGLIDIPLIAAGMVLDSAFERIGFNPQLKFFLAKSSNAAFTAFTAVIVYLFSLNIYRKERLSVALALIYGLTTLAVPYAQMGMDPLLVLLAFWGFYLLRRCAETGSVRNFILAGFVFGLAMGTKTYAAILYPFAALYLFMLLRNNPIQGLPAKLALAAAGGIVGLVPYFWYNYIQFHELLASSERGSFASKIFASPSLFLTIRNIYGSFFSFGKSFFLYSPPLVLVFWGFKHFFSRARIEAWVFLLFSLFVLVLFCSMDIPIYWADEVWGPRYYLLLVPFLVLTMGGIIERFSDYSYLEKTGFYILLGLGFLVQLPGSLVYYGQQTNILEASKLYSLQNEFYIPELSHIPINIFLMWASLVNRFTGVFPTYYYWPRSNIYYRLKFDPIALSIDPNNDYITAWWYQILSYGFLDSLSFFLVVLVVLTLLAGFAFFGIKAWRSATRAEASQVL